MKLNELHMILYDMLCEIDDACKAENVPYTLGGGTMLGAVRNHDFIPWDDDADLAVWGKDYPAMISALRRHLPTYLRVIEPQQFSPCFYDFITRVQDTRYHWHQPTAEDEFYDNNQNYVSVDIFIINHTASTLHGLHWHSVQHKLIYALALGHRYQICINQYPLLPRLGIRLLSAIGRRISIQQIYAWHEQLSRKYDNSTGKYCIISNNIPRYIGLPYEKAWFEGTIDILFKNRFFPVQKGFHQKLTLQYGDYMIPDSGNKTYVIHADCEDMEELMSKKGIL